MHETQQHRILVVDDERSLLEAIVPFLQRAGFAVTTAENGAEARSLIARARPDLIVLDVLMPVLDGRALLRALRSAEDWVPVILLTQVGDATERAMALTEGADDYLNKPFDPHELVARINSVLRRARPGEVPLASQSVLVAGELRFDRDARRVMLAGERLVLTPRATQVLEFMLLHPDELLTRERLLDAVWGWQFVTGTRSVDARIAELRRVLGDDPQEPRFIETVPAGGYRFVYTKAAASEIQS